MQEIISRLRSYQNGVHGPFFLEVAAKLEHMWRSAQPVVPEGCRLVIVPRQPAADETEYRAFLEKFQPDTLRNMIIDLSAAQSKQEDALQLIAAASLGQTGPEARGQLEKVKKIAKGALA
jgi:hypothetical protein